MDRTVNQTDMAKLVKEKVENMSGLGDKVSQMISNRAAKWEEERQKVSEGKQVQGGGRVCKCEIYIKTRKIVVIILYILRISNSNNKKSKFHFIFKAVMGPGARLKFPPRNLPLVISGKNSGDFRQSPEFFGRLKIRKWC
jgi:hypothetical protein